MTNTTSSSISTTKTAIYFTFDHFNKKIVGTEQNFKKSSISGTAQYNALMAAMSAHPNYELSAMAPKVKKQTYAGLNFELMMDYVEFKGNEIQKAEFEEIVSSNATYPTIKSWFLDNFKVGFTVEKATREIAQHKLGERKAKVRAAVRVKPVKAAPAVVNF
jgi:hypothetical protein